MVNIYSKSPNRPLSLHDFKPKCVHSCHHVLTRWASVTMGEGRAKNVVSPFHQVPMAAKLWIWTLRAKRTRILKRIRAFQKTPNCFLKTLRCFTPNAEAFYLKCRNVFFLPRKVNFNKSTPWKGERRFQRLHSHFRTVAQGVNAPWNEWTQHLLFPAVLTL